MRLTFIGSGNVATNLATLARQAGLETVLSSRAPESGSGRTTFAEAAATGDIVVLAIPYRFCAETLPSLAGALAGRIVVDATNPLNEDFSPIDLGSGTSAGETIAVLLPGARVVKAFNAIFAAMMTADGRDRKGRPATAFVASDDVEARNEVLALARSLGFAPVSAGVLSSSRYLEAMTNLHIRIAFVEGGGTDAAFIYDQGGVAA